MHHSINGSFSIRQGKWKLELCPGSGGWSQPKGKNTKGLPPIQLYDLEKDPGEYTNLWDSDGHQDLKRDLLLKFMYADMAIEPMPMPRICGA